MRRAPQVPSDEPDLAAIEQFFGGNATVTKRDDGTYLITLTGDVRTAGIVMPGGQDWYLDLAGHQIIGTSPDGVPTLLVRDADSSLSIGGGTVRGADNSADAGDALRVTNGTLTVRDGIYEGGSARGTRGIGGCALSVYGAKQVAVSSGRLTGGYGTLAGGCGIYAQGADSQLTLGRDHVFAKSYRDLEVAGGGSDDANGYGNGLTVEEVGHVTILSGDFSAGHDAFGKSHQGYTQFSWVPNVGENSWMPGNVSDSWDQLYRYDRDEIGPDFPTGYGMVIVGDKISSYQTVSAGHFESIRVTKAEFADLLTNKDDVTAYDANGNVADVADTMGPTTFVTTKDSRSSDAGPWEQTDVYQLVISYKDDKGNEIAAGVHQALQDGETYSIWSPALAGWELSSPDQRIVSGTASGENHRLYYTVTYHAAQASYTVVTELQEGDVYRVASSETRQAPVGSEVSAQPQAFEGYTLNQRDSVASTKVTADGNALIVLRYDVIDRYVFYDSDGGSFVPAWKVTVPSHAEVPTRTGYVFRGWDTDGDGQANTGSDGTIVNLGNANVNAKAIWDGQEVGYVVRYWGEAVGHHGDGNYRLLGSESLRGKAGTLIASPADLGALQGRPDNSRGGQYQYYADPTLEETAILGDGSTVVDVRYDWRPVTVRYLVGISTDDAKEDEVISVPVVATKTGYMTCPITAPSDEEATATYANASQQPGRWSYRLFAWYSRKRNVVVPRTMDLQDVDVNWGANGELTVDIKGLIARSDQPVPRSLYLIYDCQNPGGEGYDREVNAYEVTNGDYGLDDGTTRLQSRRSDAYGHQHQYWGIVSNSRLYTFKDARISQSYWDGQDYGTITQWRPAVMFPHGSTQLLQPLMPIQRSSNVYEITLDRVKYNLTLVAANGSSTTESYRWGAHVSGLSELGNDANGLPLGWYYFTAQGDRVFVDDAHPLEMPVGDVTLYVGINKPATVSYDSAGGTALPSQTVYYGGHVRRPADPVRRGFTFDGWYYTPAAGSGSEPFSFDTALEENVVLHASWKQDRVTPAKTTWTAIHVADDGTVLFTESHEGAVGDVVTATALPAAQRGGWTFASCPRITSVLGNGSSSNVVTFTYSREPVRTYDVKFVDAATGRSLAGDRVVSGNDAVLDVRAENIAGYTVRNGGAGYLLAGSNGKATLTFLYDKAPDQPDTPNPPQPEKPTGPVEPMGPSEPERPSDYGQPGQPSNAERPQVSSHDKALPSAGHMAGGPQRVAGRGPRHLAVSHGDVDASIGSSHTSARTPAHALPQTGDAGSGAATAAAGGGLAALLGGIFGRRRRHGRR